MAGGSGERFYPLSRASKPKQLLPLITPGKMMIEETIERIAPIIPVEDVFIITSATLQHSIRQLLPSIPPQNVIAEPYKRNTAPCLALASSVISARYSSTHSADSISIAVLSADHYIGDSSLYCSQVQNALEFAEQNPMIVTLGIRPSRPETGYGYIEVGEVISGDVCKVDRFREKPNSETAQEFLEAGNFLWNSGMFFYRCDTFISGMIEHVPDIGKAIATMTTALEHDVFVPIDGASLSITEIFHNFDDISIDFALMEKADNVAVIPSQFNWDDVGSWDSLQRTNTSDENNNIVVGDSTTIIDTTDSIIANYSSNQSMMVSAVGIDNLIVIITDDSIVVCPKDKAQDVKKAVTLMRKRGQDSWL